MPTVLIVDDHVVLRKGVASCLEQTRLQVQCDEAANGEEALRKVAHRTYNLVLLDISLSGMSGLEVLRQLKCKHPSLPVLMLSMYLEADFAIQALRLGACGYLTKENACEELETAVQQALSGRLFISPSLAEILAVHLGSGVDNPVLPHDVLAGREVQVLRLLGSGLTPTQIAEKLSLSVRTIHTYRSRVLAKLKLSSSAELIKYALQHRLSD